MPNTPRKSSSSAASELETHAGSKPSTPRSVVPSQSAAADSSKKPEILNAKAGSYLPREEHYGWMTWLARRTSAAKLATIFYERASSSSDSSSKDGSKNSSREPSPSTGPR